MNHLQYDKEIFGAYRAPVPHTLIREQTDRDTSYVTISQIQSNLKIALEDMCKPLQALIKGASSGINLRKIADIHTEFKQGDASLVIPYLPMITKRPTLQEARELVIQHYSMVLPDDVISWLESAPKDGAIIIRDDIVGERSTLLVPVSSIEV